MTRKLTTPQAALLSEIRESSTGGLWIDMHKRYARTADALWDRGLIRRVDSTRGQIFFEAVPDVEIARQP